jgi:hypothetical protein
MKTLYKLFKTKDEYEQSGVWLDFGSDIRIKVARAGGKNIKFISKYNKLMRKYGRAIDYDNMSEEESLQALAELFADTIILDWSNVTDENGIPLEFNRMNVIKVLKDLPDLFAIIRAEANKPSNFKDKDEYIEEAVKN